ncbi:phage tail protein [Clostridioides difficile]|uniref:phage tail protein n=5 Tax=Clostridioides difficile TaxID=1496 RepID=UPI0021C33BFB|nr:phage tail protein [Clostridioides difficile]UUC40259.1 phage tail protein [Clostridioides difficile]
MSWAEVYKINSDIQGEPLNYLNYLQDLKLNGSESYLLYEGNHRIWEELYLNSLYLFSDRGIREVVYTAFSETDIDNLFDKGIKLGEQLNAFYRTDIFSLGNADNVVKGMTVEHYNSLEEKFKAGYDRYVTREQEKETIGAWFNSTFSLNNIDLENLTTIEEILVNVEATNAILNNSNAIVALTMCKTSMDAVVASPNAMDLLGQYILKVTAEPAVIKAILENNVIREAIINSTEAMTHISTNQESVSYIFKNLEAIQLLLANQESLNLVLANQNVVKNILANILKTYNALYNIESNKTNLISNSNTAYNSTNLIVEGELFYLIKDINIEYKSLKEALVVIGEDTVTVLNICKSIENNLSIITAIANNQEAFNSVKEVDLAISKIVAKLAGLDNATIYTSDALARSDKYMNAVASSSTAMNAVASSSTAMNAVASSSTAMNAVASSSTAMNAVASSSTAMNAVASSSTAMNAVASSSTAMNAVASSSTAMNAVASSSTAMNAVASSSTAMNAVASSSTAMNAVASSQIGVNTIINNSGFLNIVISSSTAMSAIAGSSTAMSAIAGSSTAMSAIAGSSTAMSAIAGSSTAMSAIAGKPVAISAIIKSTMACSKIDSKIQSYRSTLVNSLNNASYFTKTTEISTNSNGNGTTLDRTLYTGNKIIIPTQFRDKGSGANTITLYSSSTNIQIYNTTITQTTVSITSGVALRGVRELHGTYYPSENEITYDVYTAR